MKLCRILHMFDTPVGHTSCTRVFFLRICHVLTYRGHVGVAVFEQHLICFISLNFSSMCVYISGHNTFYNFIEV